MRAAIAGVGDEFWRLASGTVGIWLRLLPRLLALTLFGWVAYHGTVLLGTEVARLSPWLVIVALALGLVVQLATVVIALRTVATELDAPALLRRLAPAEVADDDRDRSLGRLLGITLLPFLAVYAAFGYVDNFARDVVLLSTFRFGPGELLNQLNPLADATTAVVLVVLVVGSYVGRRLLDRWQERGGGVVAAVLGSFVEACGLFAVLLGGFRLLDEARLWLADRRLAQWWDQALQAVSGWLRIDLPEWLDAIWGFFAESVWPVFWDVLSQPIAWLTLAALVFGSKVLSLGELWDATPAGRSRRLARLRRAVDRVDGRPGVVGHLRETLLGDLDDKYLPAWMSLRLVLRAGWRFLGAFVLWFNVIRYAGEWARDAVVAAIGGQPVAAWIKAFPFLDLIPNAFGMSLQLALLGVAFVRILQLRVQAETAPAAAPRPGLAAELGALALALAVVTTAVVLRPDADQAVRTVAVGEPARFHGGQVAVDGVQAGGSLVLPGGRVERSPLVFVVVRGRAVRPGAAEVLVEPRLVNGDRTYRLGRWGAGSLAPEPGFSNASDFVFEVQPSDLPGLELEYTSLGLVSYYADAVRVPLGFGRADVAAAPGQVATAAVAGEVRVA